MKMPIYEYECEKCHEVMEISQKISEPPKTTCPKCSGSLKKLISVSSFMLKGGGWYSDGYNGPSNNTSSKKSDTSSSSTDSKKPAACPKSADSPCCACHSS